MKKFVYVLMFVALIAVGSAVFSCSSDEPVPELVEQEGSGKTNYGLNKKDSLFVVDMIRIMVERDALPETMNWDPEDAETWNNTRWARSEETGEYRLYSIIISPKSGTHCPISPKIKDCEYLWDLIIQNGVSEIPEEICDLNLTELCIFDTPLQSLPDDIFSELLEVVRIERNPGLTKLPSSLTKLTTHPDVITYFNIMANGFTGEIPPISRALVGLWYNKFTSIKFSEESLVRGNRIGAYAVQNNITGTLSDDLLSDTVKLYRVYGQARWQNEGYGFSNMPSDDEMEEMRLEWNQNHPDMKL